MHLCRESAHRFESRLSEHGCAYIYEMSDVFTDMNSINFTMNVGRFQNPMEATIDDWDVCVHILAIYKSHFSFENFRMTSVPYTKIRLYMHLRRRRKTISAFFLNKRSRIALKKSILRDLVPNCGPFPLISHQLTTMQYYFSDIILDFIQENISDKIYKLTNHKTRDNLIYLKVIYQPRLEWPISV